MSSDTLNQNPTPAADEQQTTAAESAATPTQDLSADVAVAAEGSPSTEAEVDPSDDAASEGEDEGDEGEEGSEGESTAPGEATKRKRKRKRKKKTASPDEAGRANRPATERAPFHVGEEVFGKVTAVLETAIMVDLSGKALAVFDRGEMETDDLVPEVGDRFVAHVHQDGGRGGLVVLTRKPLREEESKVRVEAAHKDGTLVQGLITGVIKGGAEVDIDGVRAFAPASGLDLHPANANFTQLVGQRLDFKVIQFKAAGKDVVVTRRPMLESEAHDRRKGALSLLTPDQVLRGVVRTVVEWGAFVALPDAENLEGLIHMTEASHDSRAKLTELFKPGESFDVKILKIDEKGKIWLSRKALLENPWQTVKDRFAPGTRVTSKVKKLEPFGAFVELTPGVEALLHVADLSFDRIEHPSELLSEGQDLDVIVHHVDGKNRKISVHPAPVGEAADEAPQKLTRGGVINVEVVRVEEAGLVCRVLGMSGRSARGFLPAGQTGTPRGTELRKIFPVGTKLEVKVVEVDPRRGEPKLSIRAVAEDEERRAHKEYRQKVAAESKFGTLGDLLAKKLGR